ncbi:MAG: DUF1554 domain-containing protein [Myxococcales bacterium]|nr:DUF1554 domain-containing protein [Myxococcales bacterium]
MGLPCHGRYARRLLCVEQSRTPRPPPLPSVRKRVFVTSTTFNGNLGGPSGADMRCQTAATAGNKGGTWLAYLASGTVTGPSRLTAPGPWFQERADGTFILTYNNTANLQTGALSPLNTDEQGRVLGSSAPFWTGMNSDSTTSFNTCTSWASSSSSFDGALGNGTTLFSSLGSSFNAYRLLCIEQ